MARLTFVFRTDVHLSDRSPSSWKGDYPAEIWSNLEQIGEIAKSVGASAVLDGGDFFHVKAASRNSHALVARTATIHQVYPCPVYAIAGNHDIAFNSLDTLPRQPLGVLFESGVFQRLQEQIFVDGDMQVRVVGMPYSSFRTLDELRAIRKRHEDRYLIAVVHALAGDNPPEKVEDFFKEPVFHYRDLVAHDGPDVWLFGHWHKDQGIKEIDGKLFVNQGAVSRGSLIRENTERTPQVTVVELTDEGVKARTVDLNVPPATAVFDFERKQKLESERRDIETFIAKLQSDLAFDPSATIEDNVQSLDFAAEVREAALGYLDQARSEAGCT